MKRGLHPTQFLFLMAGMIPAIFLGERLFPDLAAALGSTLFAALKGGIGAAAGLIAYEGYRRVWPERR